MKIAIVAGVGLLSLLSLAAIAQTGLTAATNGPKAEAVVDAQGSLRVPADYRTTYQFLGSWAVAADQGQGSNRSISFMRPRARSPPIIKMGISRMARCW